MNVIEWLRALEQSATPGPWRIVPILGARPLVMGSRWIEGYEHDSTVADANEPDSALIAAMRNALPDLLAVVDAAHQWVENRPKDDWEGHPADCEMARSDTYGKGEDAGLEMWLDTSEACTCGLTAAREALARLQGDKE